MEVYVPAPLPPATSAKPLAKNVKSAERRADDSIVSGGTAKLTAAPATAESEALLLLLPAAPNAAPNAATTAATVAAVEQSSIMAPDRPMIAIIIDDMGVDRRRSQRILGLKGPLTVSFLTYAEDLGRQTAAAREAGHEVLLHLPMEPGDQRIDPGPNVLLRDIEPDELRRRLEWGLNRFHGYVGVNNHMGRKFTADRPSMAILMRELKRRNVFFLDSRTSSKSVGSSMARRFKVPVVERNVFLDNDNDSGAVKARLAETERLGAASRRRDRHRPPTGHGTLAALSEWLPTVEARGFELVALTIILARRRAGIKPARLSSSWRPEPDSSAR